MSIDNMPLKTLLGKNPVEKNPSEGKIVHISFIMLDVAIFKTFSGKTIWDKTIGEGKEYNTYFSPQINPLLDISETMHTNLISQPLKY